MVKLVQDQGLLTMPKVDLSDDYGVINAGIEEMLAHASQLIKRRTEAKGGVAIFGSARDAVGDDNLSKTHRFSLRAAQSGYLVITGGGENGIMRAANEGAYIVDPRLSLGLNINLPFEQRPNPFQEIVSSFEYGKFFPRKINMIFNSDAVVGVAGGFGTADEILEAIYLKSKGKIDREFPIVLLGEKFWAPIDNYIRRLSSEGVLPPYETLGITLTDSADIAWDVVKNAPTQDFSDGEDRFIEFLSAMEDEAHRIDPLIQGFTKKRISFSVAGNPLGELQTDPELLTELAKFCSEYDLGVITSHNQAISQHLAKHMDESSNILNFYSHEEESPISGAIGLPYKNRAVREVLTAANSDASFFIEQDISSLDSLFEILTLKQTRKLSTDKPIILIGEHWHKLDTLIYEQFEKGLTITGPGERDGGFYPGDRSLYTIIDNVSTLREFLPEILDLVQEEVSFPRAPSYAIP